MKPREQTGIDSSTERIPPKPTKESATGSSTAREALRQRQEPAGGNAPEHLGTERPADDTETPRIQPHLPEPEREGELRDRFPIPRRGPVLPANASGRDSLTPEEQNEEIDDESMYDRRPERDKDRPPSHRRY